MRERLLSLNDDRFRAYPKGSFERGWGYLSNARAPEFLLIAAKGHSFTVRSARHTFPFGIHGFPMPNEDMEAILMVRSPRLRREHVGEVVGPANSIDVHPLLEKLMGVRRSTTDASDVLLGYFD